MRLEGETCAVCAHKVSRVMYKKQQSVHRGIRPSFFFLVSNATCRVLLHMLTHIAV